MDIEKISKIRDRMFELTLWAMVGGVAEGLCGIWLVIDLLTRNKTPQSTHALGVVNIAVAIALFLWSYLREQVAPTETKDNTMPADPYVTAMVYVSFVLAWIAAFTAFVSDGTLITWIASALQIIMGIIWLCITIHEMEGDSGLYLPSFN